MRVTAGLSMITGFIIMGAEATTFGGQVVAAFLGFGLFAIGGAHLAKTHRGPK